MLYTRIKITYRYLIAIDIFNVSPIKRIRKKFIMDNNDEFYFDLKWRFFFKLSREKRARRVHFNDIPTRKIGKIFYLAIILEALTVRSVSRVNSLKIRIAVRFSCRIKRIKGLNLWSAKETTRVSKQGVLDTLSMKPVNGLYLLHCCLTTTYLPKTSSYFKLFAYTLKYNLIRQTIRPPFIKYSSNVNRNVKEFSLWLSSFQVN